ncbi:MAG: DeoR family transcriptional regulator [Anaerolineaceae bacterium]|nr:DeoR family transcriptional regulator [Anaerolineaceae bacterium]
MKNNARLDRIVAIVNQHSFLTVNEISELCDVSEMTIRRDLNELQKQGRIMRTYGGAVSIQNDHAQVSIENPVDVPLEKRKEVLLVDQVDVLIGTSVNPYYDNILVDRASKKHIPIIAESIEMPNQCTVVNVDNYQAGFDLGSWAGNYLQRQGVKKINLLDLTFDKPNTQLRSRGFVVGLNVTSLSNEVVLSINSQSRYATAYQLSLDALTVYPHINLIFAINDITAWAAINACRDLNINPANMTVITFGLEGKTLKNALMSENSYCKAGLAMFPEIVSLTCIEAAIKANNHLEQPKKYITPHVILTQESLPEYYTKKDDDWELNWKTVHDTLNIPINIESETPQSVANMPKQIGLIVPFIEHEWYKNLTTLLKDYAGKYGIGLQVIDADQNVRDEVDFRRRQIAIKAANLVEPGDVVAVDGGQIAQYLAEQLKQKKGITVITNSMVVFDILNHTPDMLLITTGGAVRYSTQMLVGPTAEGALKELRADKLFLMVSGITPDFGMYHHTISEVTVKQAMIHMAREVILLADHTVFNDEVGIQVAPLTAAQKLVTDDALPPSTRLDISKLGIQILLA